MRLWSVRKLVVAWLAVVGLMAVGAGLAQANIAHEKIGEFISRGNIPEGLAINQSTHDLYVANTVQGTVAELNAAGTEELNTITGGKEGHPFGTFEETGLAIDNTSDSSAGDLYVTDEVNSVVDKFTSEGVFICEVDEGEAACPGAKSPAPFNHPSAVAVDSHGDVYVSDTGNDVVDVFSPSGEYVTQITASNSLPLQGPRALAVNSHGNVYVATAGTKATYAVVEFKPSAEVVVNNTTWTESEFEVGSAEQDTTAIATDAVNDVYVANYTGSSAPDVSEHNEAGTVISSFGTGNEFTLLVFGLAVSNTSGDVYLSNYEGLETPEGRKGTLYLYSTRNAPTIVTGAESEVTRTSAKVEGTVEPEGLTVTDCFFEYGEEQKAACDLSAAEITGKAKATVTAQLEGLKLSTTYKYKLVIEAEGHATRGSELTFETFLIGTATTELPTEITPESVTLHGTVKLNLPAARYYFRYGTAAEGYTSTSPALPGGELSGEGVHRVSAEPTDLQAGTTYDYQLVAVSEDSAPVYGAVETFDTPDGKPTVLSELASRIFPQTALLGAVIKPGGLETTYHFLYGLTVGYGSSAPLTEAELGGGSKGLPATQSIGGLQPDSTYHYAVVASNALGVTIGPDETFTTPPATPPLVATGAASEVSQNAATISGTVNPQGLPTSYEFDLGTDTTYGSHIFGEVESGTQVVALSLSFQGLAAGTLYHYRLVATNAYGTVYGADDTFMTPGFPTALIAGPVGAPLVPSPLFTAPATGGAATVQITPGNPKHRAKKKTKVRKKGKGGKANKAGRRRSDGRGRR